MPTACDPIIRQVLRDESITRGLGDIEGRMLMEWLADWTVLFADAARSDDEAWRMTNRLCRRARAINKFVQMWQNPATRNGAGQLAAVERFRWPLPPGPIPTVRLMEQILNWENRFPDE